MGSPTSPNGYEDLRDYLGALEGAGKLLRVTRAVNKDTEIHPLVRLQFRGLKDDQRRAFLFENVRDSSGNRYSMPVLICAIAGSRDIYSLGLRCRPEEIAQHWQAALANPVPPVVVERAPVQETVIQGDELKVRGLNALPIPISTPGFDNAPYTTASHWISRDPVTGVYNLGNYRGMLKGPTRLGCCRGANVTGILRHFLAWRQAGAEAMPVAIAIGVAPHISFATVTVVPEQVSEYDVAGGLAGAPVELVRGKTVDLLVPARAEIVVEGYMPTGEVEMEGPFGEYTGYMASRGYTYFMEVSCITMRRQPIYEAFLSQFPPSESSVIRRPSAESRVRNAATAAGVDVLDVHLVESSGSWGVLFIKIRRRSAEDGQKALAAVTSSGAWNGKVGVVVDEDIDIYDPAMLFWALAFHMQPERDVRIVKVRANGLDPSVHAPEPVRTQLTLSGRADASSLLIDATRDWPHPPVSLPKREFMEHAIDLWQELGLPELDLRNPWFGYPLGQWGEEAETEAEWAVAGRYFETGERHARDYRRPFAPEGDR